MLQPISFIEQLKIVSENYADKKAFQINGATYSYSEFYQKVAEITCKITTDTPRKIIVITNNDLETYASIIAIWLTGNTYIPIACNEDTERLKMIIKIIDADIVLSSNKISKSCFSNLKMVNTSAIPAATKSFAKISINNSTIAYILFTSGTTGIPKGVPISYQNLAAFVDSFISLNYSFSSNDHFLQMADLTFDMSIISTLIPLCLGAEITAINTEEIKYLATYKALSEQAITVLITAPSTLQLLEPYYSEINLEHLNYTFVGAEAFHESTAKQWQTCAPNSKIINLYGPSEGGILATTYTWNKNETNQHQGVVCIGKAVKNINLYIVDETRSIITDGKEGEAWISGSQVFNSYLEEKMNLNNFEYLNLQGKKQKCFKTGDILFRDENENLFYCGRKDEQIKVQGKRIELNEIEYFAGNILGKFKPAAICYKGEFESNRIALFIDEDIVINELTNYLKAHLPAYMIPTRIIGIPALPLNKNQKVDKKALTLLL